MGRRMGKGCLNFRDGTELDLDYAFPTELKTVAMSMSGGVESAALYLLLERFYGKDNVYVFSAHIDRRDWEAEKAKALCEYLHVSHSTHFRVLNDNFHDMSPLENKRLRMMARKAVRFDGWFNGANKLLFAPTKILSNDHKQLVRSEGVYLPFIDLLKQNTIEIFYLLGRQDVLWNTHSCTINHFDEGHCGKCYCCHERVRGFGVLGEKDKATYNVEWEEILNECYYSDKHTVKNW